MVDKMYETHFKTKYNKMEFYNINAKAPTFVYGLDSDFETYVHVLMQKVK